MVVVVVAAAITGALLWHVSASYNALAAVGWYGPQPGRPMHVTWTRQGNAHRLLGPAGTTQAFEFGLVNDGPHPLTITGIDPPPWHGPGPDPVSAVAWAPFHFIPGGLVNGHPNRSQQFPANVPAHGTIKIRFTVTKPTCPEQPRPNVHASVALRVHWHAMISSRPSVIYPFGSDYHVVLCGR